MGFNVAIDGPAGAGKSTVAKKIAEQLHFVYVDTGAMYRAIGLYVLRSGTDIHDENAVVSLLPEIDVTIRFEDGVQKVMLLQEDVSSLIRTQEVGEAASVTSAYAKVRDHLTALQLKLAKEYDVVMDGRDIGTVILPNAEVKIFLTASSHVRALRRVNELLKKGISADPDRIEEEIRERDYRDSHREVAPLKQAGDAVLLDSSDLSVDEVVERAVSLIREKRGK